MEEPDKRQPGKKDRPLVITLEESSRGFDSPTSEIRLSRACCVYYIEICSVWRCFFAGRAGLLQSAWRLRPRSEPEQDNKREY